MTTTGIFLWIASLETFLRRWSPSQNWKPCKCLWEWDLKLNNPHDCARNVSENPISVSSETANEFCPLLALQGSSCGSTYINNCGLTCTYDEVDSGACRESIEWLSHFIITRSVCLLANECTVPTLFASTCSVQDEVTYVQSTACSGLCPEGYSGSPSGICHPTHTVMQINGCNCE